MASMFFKTAETIVKFEDKNKDVDERSWRFKELDDGFKVQELLQFILNGISGQWHPKNFLLQHCMNRANVPINWERKHLAKERCKR